MTTRTAGGERTALLDEALSGRLGWQAVRRIAAQPRDHGLTPLLEACGLGRPADLVLTRTKFKPDRKLTAHYRLRANDGRVRHLAVAWRGSSALGVQHEAAVRSEPPPGLGATSPDGRLSLLVSPADPRMPQLERLHRTDHLGGLLAGLDRRPLPVKLDVETIRYRPGERHVLRVSSQPWSVQFLKTDRDDSGSRAVPIAMAVSATLARHCPEAGIAEPVGYAPDDRAAVWRLAEGRPLSRQLEADARAGAALLVLIGRAIRSIHDNTDAFGGALAGDRLGAPRTGRAEAVSTVRAGEHITALLPGVGGRYEDTVAEVARALEGLPAESPTLIHGDLKCDNVMTTGRRIQLLDFDRSGIGDPAIDLGRLMADLRWWLVGREQTSGELMAALEWGYGPCDPARWHRARMLAVLYQLKQAARRCAVHDESWPHDVHARILAARAALERERVSA